MTNRNENNKKKKIINRYISPHKTTFEVYFYQKMKYSGSPKLFHSTFFPRYRELQTFNRKINIHLYVAVDLSS